MSILTAMARYLTSEGTVPFNFNGEKYHTWYKIKGDLATTRRPLVVLHGGPGLSHDYMVSLADLTQQDIPVIFYDQLGNGRSMRLPHKVPWFWTIELFVAELLNLLEELGVTQDFDILGHSWGGILALECVMRAQPPGLKHLVLSNSPASWALRNESRARLLAALSEDIRHGLEAEGTDPVRFRAALDAYDARYMVTLRPMPAEWTRSIDYAYGPGGDASVRNAMFHGPLKEWSSIDRLHQVSVPTLIVNGTNEIAQDFVVEPFFRLIPKVKWVTFGQSSHCPHMEERERFMVLVDNFLKL